MCLPLVALCFGFGPTPSSPTPPGTRFDFLNRWELQTCWQSPSVVQGQQLQHYVSSHFYLNSSSSSSSGPAVVFTTPDNSSARTTHSTHPRTELRDISVPDWRWPGVGTRGASKVEGAAQDHVLKATVAVDHVAATKPETIIAQIHGSVDEEIAKIVRCCIVQTTARQHTANALEDVARALRSFSCPPLRRPLTQRVSIWIWSDVRSTMTSSLPADEGQTAVDWWVG